MDGPYQPLKLGPWRATRPAGESLEQGGGPAPYALGGDKNLDEGQPEDRVFDGLRREFASTWLQPVLGDPGAGKSRLLSEWASRLAVSEVAFIRLRSLAEADGTLVGETLATRLLAISDGAGRVVGRLHIHPVPSVWLLDGLDEVPAAAWNAGFADALTELPGAKIATCRTAVFPGLRQRLGEGLGAGWRAAIAIRPLDRDDRRTFLRRTFQVNQLPLEEADALASEIEASAPLRELAGSLLLLGLMAEFGSPLPTSRIAFYEWAEARLGARHAQGPNHDVVWADAPETLDRIAIAMTRDRFEAPVGEAVKACASHPGLFEALRSSGLLIMDSDRGRFAFLHPTFQEYHLARAFQEDPGIAKALDLYWRDPRYQETIALLVAMEVKKKGGVETVSSALDGLVETGRRLFKNEPEEIFKDGRSPTRVALHLLGQSGSDAVVSQGMMSLDPLPRWHSAFKIAVASDSHSPPTILGALAHDADANVWRRAAENPSTPAATLESLARSDDAGNHVRWSVAENPSMPKAALEALAEDTDSDVRQKAARNHSTPTATLESLARNRDEEWMVRQEAAKNSSMPAATLEALACDTNAFVRGAAAANPSTPVTALEDLARDGDSIMLCGAAANPSMPVAVLENLAHDGSALVRQEAAANQSTPVATLKALVHDRDALVRRRATANPSMPTMTLEALASDADPAVRRGAAENPSTPTATLKALADDAAEYVRVGAADNPSTPAEALATLARDANADVRRIATANSSTPAATLEAMVRDASSHVRWLAATNPSTVLEVLMVSRFTKRWWRCRRVLMTLMTPFAFFVRSAGTLNRGLIGQALRAVVAFAGREAGAGFFKTIGTALAVSFVAFWAAWNAGVVGAVREVVKQSWSHLLRLVGL
ncbi:MAG: hypothetical protein P4L10_07885 [Acidobacteriaceae bacterium]|nr:hypothetical protein [Acidobacteriaceae bacterium]